MSNTPNFSEIGGSSRFNFGKKGWLAIGGAALAVAGGITLANRVGVTITDSPSTDDLATVKTAFRNAAKGASTPVNTRGTICVSYDQIGDTSLIGTSAAVKGQCDRKEVVVPKGNSVINPQSVADALALKKSGR